MKKIKSQNGFTLIEIMLVVGIITLLSSIAMFSSTEAKKKAQDTKMIVEAKQVETAITMYKDSNNDFVPYETTTTQMETGKLYAENTDQYKKSMEKLVPKYLSKIPESPDGNSYYYGISENKKKAVFMANLKTQKSKNNSSSSNDSCILTPVDSAPSCEYFLDGAFQNQNIFVADACNISYDSNTQTCIDKYTLFNSSHTFYDYCDQVVNCNPNILPNRPFPVGVCNDYCSIKGTSAWDETSGYLCTNSNGQCSRLGYTMAQEEVFVSQDCNTISYDSENNICLASDTLESSCSCPAGLSDYPATVSNKSCSEYCSLAQEDKDTMGGLICSQNNTETENSSVCNGQNENEYCKCI